MIDGRDDLDLDWDAVYGEAARTGTALEMNGSPHRLDLAVERARRAVAIGLRAVGRLGRAQDRRVLVPRLGHQPGAPRVGRAPADVLNTRSRADLLAWVAGQAGRAVATRACRCRADHARTGRARRRIGPPGATWPSPRSPSSGCRASSSRRPSGTSPIFLLGAMLLGTLQVLADETLRATGDGLGVPIESLILPAVAAVACVGAIRLVPFGLWLVPALLADRPHRRRAASRWRRASWPRRDGARRGRPDRGPRHDPARRVPRLRRRRRDRPGRARRSRARDGAAGGPLPEGDLLALAARPTRVDRVPARLSRGGAARAGPCATPLLVRR